MKIGIDIHIKGAIDVPDSWDDPNNPQAVLDVADFRYTDQLTENEVITELTEKLCTNADTVEVTFRFNREVK